MHEEKLVRLRSTLTAATAAALLALPAAAVARAAPPPLSADTAPVNISSTYGSGDFGRWTVDRGACRPTTTGSTSWPTRSPSSPSERLGQQQRLEPVGNDHVVADASITATSSSGARTACTSGRTTTTPRTGITRAGSGT